MIIGIDIGGTFTDFAAVDDAGRVRVHKRLTTAADPARAVLDGLADLGAPFDAVLVHGSTIATNALLERKGARTALITTRGFADVIDIGRQNRPALYALEPAKPEPLVPRERRFEIDERVAADGTVLRPLDPRAVEALIPRLQAEGVEAVAVCFLFSFLRPDHERTVDRILSRLTEMNGRPSWFVSLSCDILPEYREYERASTTVINAYVAPLMARYLERLAAGLGGRRLRIMQSNGGAISASTAAAQAARTALSGPAGGVIGAFRAAQHAFASLADDPAQFPGAGWEGEPGARAITFDMGGTSTDVALCAGAPPTTTEGEIAGLPLRLPILDIHTVGAGGGSIARLDAGGALIVGPQSAGADPGPACYGRGGTQPTVTDANLVLGRLDADHFLGGRMKLDPAAARRAVASLHLDAPVERRAWGIVQVANAAMERAIRTISVERGHDPRRFMLVAFGGAGPLHACELADALGIPVVLVPPSPGVLSALGMATADTVKDYSRAVLRRADHIGDELAGVWEELERRGQSELLVEGIAPAQSTLRHALDVRYVGQSYEITVELPVADPPGDGGGTTGRSTRRPSLSAFVDAFHRLHAKRYGHSHADRAVEIVAARVKAVGRARLPDRPGEAERDGDEEASAAVVGRRAVWFGGGPIDTALYDRERLRAGQRAAGPAILFQFDTTTVVPPGWLVRADGAGNLILRRMPRGA